MATTPLTNAFISLNDIINNFLISYTGPGKLIPDAKRTEVVFHARRCLQEFAYETLKSQFIQTGNISGVTVNAFINQPESNVAIISIAYESGVPANPPVYDQEMTETNTLADVSTTKYYVDYAAKKVMFLLSLSAKAYKYTYLSNALTTDESAAIPKLAEEALYSCMVYAILANRENTNPNTLQRLLIEKIDKLERSKSRLIFTNFTD